MGDHIVAFFVIFLQHHLSLWSSQSLIQYGVWKEIEVEDFILYSTTSVTTERNKRCERVKAFNLKLLQFVHFIGVSVTADLWESSKNVDFTPDLVENFQ